MTLFAQNLQRLALCLLAISVMATCKPEPAPRPSRAPTIPSFKTVKEMLKSQEWRERAQAVLHISNADYRQGASLLIEHLEKDVHPAVRGSAALVLGNFKHKPALKPIIKALQQDSQISKDHLIDALRRMKDPEGAVAVLPFLESDSEAMQLQCVKALVAMKASFLGRRIIAQAKKTNKKRNLKIYAQLLGDLKVRSAEAFLITQAKSTSQRSLLAPLYNALGKIRSRSAISLLIAALKSDFDMGRANAVVALIEIGDHSASAGVFPLVLDAKEEVRLAAAKVIIGLKSPTSAREAYVALKTAKVELGQGLIRIISQLKYQPATRLIKKLLQQNEHPHRESLAQALGWLESHDNIKLLIKVLKEPSGNGRHGAAWALGLLKAQEAITHLNNAVESADSKLSKLAVESLGLIGSAKSIPVLLRLMNADPNTSFWVADALMTITDDKARLELEKYAIDGDLRQRQASINALGGRKDVRSVHVLMKIVKEDHDEILRFTYSALTDLTGERLASRGDWLTWYGRKYPNLL